MSDKLALTEVAKYYGDFAAVKNVSFTLADGESVALLGPSGCGKTTTLRMVAGFLRLNAGTIEIDGKLVASPVQSLSPHQRDVALVFQSYAVWPHRTVFDNVAYGLRLRKVSRRDIEHQVNEILGVVQLQGLAGRYPGELSGGQQQRVSLARSLVITPSILLLDEPLSNLDATLREEMRFEVRALQRRMGITMLYVTHDQGEAMVIADRIVVMNEGMIEQIGTPDDIYIRSANAFVAGFVGLTNFLNGRLDAPANGGAAVVESTPVGRLEVSASPEKGSSPEVTVNIRPEDIRLLESSEDGLANLFPAVVEERAFLGAYQDYRVRVGETVLRVQTPGDLRFEVKKQVYVHLDPAKIRCFPQS